MLVRRAFEEDCPGRLYVPAEFFHKAGFSHACFSGDESDGSLASRRLVEKFAQGSLFFFPVHELCFEFKGRLVHRCQNIVLRVRIMLSKVETEIHWSSRVSPSSLLFPTVQNPPAHRIFPR